MIDIFNPDIIKNWEALGLHGAMSFIILAQIVAWILALRLIGDKIIPLTKNHLEHIQSAFDRLAESYENNTALLRSLKDVHQAQAQAMELHNELTSGLLEQLKREKRSERKTTKQAA